MTEKTKTELFKVIDENLDTILGLGYFIAVIDSSDGEIEHLVYLDKEDLGEMELTDAYIILEAIDKNYIFNSSFYGVNQPRTIAMYRNLGKIIEKIHNMNKPLDQIDFICVVSGGKIETKSICISESSNPMILLRTIYNCHKYFTVS